MDWLSQNWIWVALAIGVALFFARSGLGHHAGGHSGHGGGIGGLPGRMGHGGHGSRDEEPDTQEKTDSPEAAVDPVSGEAVRTAQALTSLYQGKIYYFASRENRDRFEAAPHEYAHKATGYPVRAAAEAPRERPRRRGGC